MKRIVALLMMAVSVIGFTGCEKEPASNNNSEVPEVPQTIDIVRTSWRGEYNGTVQHPQAGPLPCELVWTMDFVDENNVSIMLEMTTGGQSQEPQEMTAQYTFDGQKGEVIYVEEGETQKDPFVVDPVNRTLTIDFRITTGFSQENPQVVGGPTTFHQIH